LFVHVKTDDGLEGLGITEPKDGLWPPCQDCPGPGLELDPTAVRLYAV